ncbi:MAG TPA: ABC transporter ATP-binding protein, partial [Inquilinus sp.]
MATLELDRLTKRFGDTAAVDRVSLAIGDGELVCLLGPSGCGKSTVLRMIGGFETPSDGRVAIDGADIGALPPNRRPTGMVFQSHALWPHMTVARNIAFGLRLRPLSRGEVGRRVDGVLELVGLTGYGGRYPGQLSGGQQQRVAIARCVVLEPKILLMDEPFSALDAHLRVRLREEVRAIQRRLGLTTVFVTHDQEEAMTLADRIVVMKDGRIEQVGRPGEIYARPETEFVA